MTAGFVRLMAAAALEETVECCPNCKNPDWAKLGAAKHAECVCPECKEQFFPDQALAVNFLKDALAIWGDSDFDTPRFEHVHYLAEHAQECHQRIAELEETLAAERERLTGARRHMQEILFQVERAQLARELVHAG